MRSKGFTDELRKRKRDGLQQDIYTCHGSREREMTSTPRHSELEKHCCSILDVTILSSPFGETKISESEKLQFRRLKLLDITNLVTNKSQ